MFMIKKVPTSHEFAFPNRGNIPTRLLAPGSLIANLNSGGGGLPPSVEWIAHNGAYNQIDVRACQEKGAFP